MPDDKDSNSRESEVQGNTSSQDYEGLPPCPNPEPLLATLVEPRSILCIVFDLETTVLSRLKSFIINLTPIMINRELIMAKDSSFHYLVNTQ